MIICTLYNVQVLKTKTILNNKNYARVVRLFNIIYSMCCSVKTLFVFPMLFKKKRSDSETGDKKEKNSHLTDILF